MTKLKKKVQKIRENVVVDKEKSAYIIPGQL